MNTSVITKAAKKKIIIIKNQGRRTKNKRKFNLASDSLSILTRKYISAISPQIFVDIFCLLSFGKFSNKIKMKTRLILGVTLNILTIQLYISSFVLLIFLYPGKLCIKGASASINFCSSSASCCVLNRNCFL